MPPGWWPSLAVDQSSWPVLPGQLSFQVYARSDAKLAELVPQVRLHSGLRCWAICRLDSPSAARPATCRSALVSASGPVTAVRRPGATGAAVDRDG